MLPSSVDNVLAYGGTCRGDLIMTPGALYFFAHEVSTSDFGDDLRKGWRKLKNKWSALALAAELIGSQIAPGLGALVGILLHRTLPGQMTVNRSRLRAQGLWLDTDLGFMLRERLDRCVEEGRLARIRSEEFSKALPSPERFRANEVSNLKLSFGRLRFDTRYGKHDYLVGVWQLNALKTGLAEAGFAIR